MESHEIKSNSEGDRIDYGIILSVMLLALIGLVSIYLATAHDTSTLQNPVRATVMQAAWYVIGGIGIFSLCDLMRSSFGALPLIYTGLVFF